MVSKLIDVVDLIAGYAFKSRDFGTYPDKVIKITQINPPLVDLKNATGINLQKYNRSKLEKYIAKKGDFVLAMTGATIGKIGRIEEGEAYINQRVLMFKPKSNVDSNFIYYVLQSYEFSQYVLNHIDSESAQPNISANTIGNFEFDLPDIILQKKIGTLLRNFDEKAELNRRINDNLLQQLDALYHEIFDNCQMKLSCPAGSYFDISIGKTPPRKEQWWFTSNASDIRWVSISDMGNCGTYISNSSEYLTQDAVDKFNVVVVPDNTVILSFKLTVGRLAITDGDLTTNEAIAHFKTDNKAINPYLYFYLRNYKYETLGSTSSIATAVNSKIIKNMPFLLPHDAELYKFNELALPFMEKIKLLEHENKHLEQLRDSLLPKLMSGEIDVDSIKL